MVTDWIDYAMHVDHIRVVYAAWWMGGDWYESCIHASRVPRNKPGSHGSSVWEVYLYISCTCLQTVVKHM